MGLRERVWDDAASRVCASWSETQTGTTKSFCDPRGFFTYVLTLSSCVCARRVRDRRRILFSETPPWNQNTTSSQLSLPSCGQALLIHLTAHLILVVWIAAIIRRLTRFRCILCSFYV